ncbi:MAG: hypothetical protein J4O03_14215 [Chloroflexi bacterium]|nr:hypothetical protein [Chloroflexota bacterium]
MNTADANTEDCQHHWVIAPANGPMSQGVCSLCQQHRDFENSINESRWRIRSVSKPTVTPGNETPA